MALSEIYKKELKISNRMQDKAESIFHLLAFRYRHSIIPKEKRVLFEIYYEDGGTLKIELHGDKFDYVYWSFGGNRMPFRGFNCKYDLEFIKSMIERNA